MIENLTFFKLYGHCLEIDLEYGEEKHVCRIPVQEEYQPDMIGKRFLALVNTGDFDDG